MDRVKKGQVKVKLPLCLTKYHTMNTYPLLNYHAMKAYAGVDIQLHAFTTSALECSASCHGCFTSRRERAPCNHWRGGWVDPTANLDVVAKRQKALPLLGIKHWSYSL
jgi:hypothetical protein